MRRARNRHTPLARVRRSLRSRSKTAPVRTPGRAREDAAAKARRVEVAQNRRKRRRARLVEKVARLALVDRLECAAAAKGNRWASQPLRPRAAPARSPPRREVSPRGALPISSLSRGVARHSRATCVVVPRARSRNAALCRPGPGDDQRHVRERAAANRADRCVYTATGATQR